MKTNNYKVGQVYKVTNPKGDSWLETVIQTGNETITELWASEDGQGAKQGICENFTYTLISEKTVLGAPELFQMVYDLKECIKRLTRDELTQEERDKEAQWEGEAHELLHRITPNYYKNANETEAQSR